MYGPIPRASSVTYRRRAVMPRPGARAVGLLSIVAASMWLGACGQTGKLVLPKVPPEPPKPTTSTDGGRHAPSR